MRWESCLGTRSAGVLRAVFDGLISYLILSYLDRRERVTSHTQVHVGVNVNSENSPRSFRACPYPIRGLTAEDRGCGIEEGPDNASLGCSLAGRGEIPFTKS